MKKVRYAITVDDGGFITNSEKDFVVGTTGSNTKLSLKQKRLVTELFVSTLWTMAALELVSQQFSAEVENKISTVNHDI